METGTFRDVGKVPGPATRMLTALRFIHNARQTDRTHFWRSSRRVPTPGARGTHANEPPLGFVLDREMDREDPREDLSLGGIRFQAT